MVDGLEFVFEITQKKANYFLKKFLLEKINIAGKEKRIAGRENTYKRTGKYKCWIIEVRKDGDKYSLNIRGSLHKFYHGNNKGSFTGSEIIGAIEGLCELFQLIPSEAQILNIEIGINLPVWFIVFPYLERNLLYHKKRARQRKEKTTEYYFKYDDHRIKLYQKVEKVLRFEIKFTSKMKLGDFGIKTLADLNQESIMKLADTLLPEFQSLLFRDELDFYDKTCRKDTLTPAEREKVISFTSIVYQESYGSKLRQATIKKKAALRQEAYRLKCACISIIRKYGNGDHHKLTQLIQTEVERFRISW